MAKIIGIHGLANKPDEATLRDYWLRSIKEGLERNCGHDDPDVPFDIVYWAGALNANPLHRRPEYPFDALYNDQPYFPAVGSGPLVEHIETRRDRLRTRLSNFAGRIVDRSYRADILDDASDWVVKSVSFTRDLNLYYENPPIPHNGGADRDVRSILHDILKAKLEENMGERLMLVAHSMGTIIAYNVLRDIGFSKRRGEARWQNFECPYFVTIGSPLGLGKVKNEIARHRDYDQEAKRLRTPTVVTEDWTNFADPEDPVSADSKLRDDYGGNDAGVRVTDDLVSNDYRAGVAPDSKPNHHKSYGYLRTPEMSRHIASFLGLPCSR